MSRESDQLVRLLATQDQDVEQAKDWMKETSDDDLCFLWEYFSQDFQKGKHKHRRCRELEVMSKFAMIGFAHIMLILEKKDTNE